VGVGEQKLPLTSPGIVPRKFYVKFLDPYLRHIADGKLRLQSSGELGEGLNMKKDVARLAVLGEYDGWAKVHPSDAKMMGGFVFFSYLQKEKPDLLDFRGGVGSKWQIVHLWLRHGGRLED
jgi:hypothetical protein